MDSSNKMAPQTALFSVFLRLRPPMAKQSNEQWLLVEPPTDSAEENDSAFPTHITLQPPNDSRKRAIERFGFTKIFQQESSQVDVFTETGTAESVKSLLQNGRDGLVATLGVTGSGKSHTILGTKTQRGLTQMTLDVLFRSIGSNIRNPHPRDAPMDANLLAALQACDCSEAQILSATAFLEMVYGDGDRARMSRAQTPMTGYTSRAQTPMMVGDPSHKIPGYFPTSPNGTRDEQGSSIPDGRDPRTSSSTTQGPSRSSLRAVHNGATCCKPLPSIPEEPVRKDRWHPPSKISIWNRLSIKRSPAKTQIVKDSMQAHSARRPPMPRPSTFALEPDVSGHTVEIDPDCDFTVLVSMYEVYNDRIFDLLSNSSSANAPAMTTRAGALQKGLMRRPLLFKNTESSPDRKVVAGLRKIVCSSYEEAMMVLETGLTERRVAGTGSNSVSSRSHGFFCIEVKKNLSKRGYNPYANDKWTGGTLSVVDLAGSERARNAKTTGSALAEAGKINESLMYLGQCLQVQSDCQQDGSKPIVPFRQCKLTELLFSNSFPSSNNSSSGYKTPQKAVMIVTADPQGDFNATSQILRYSALAREVTVPRIPSVTSTVFGNGKVPSSLQSGRVTPNESYFSVQELEQATNEVRRLVEECDALAVRLAEEEIKRTEVELKLQATEERLDATEQDIREECWEEMEAMLEEQRERWRAAWEEERLSSEEHLDGKIEILEKTSQFKIYEEPRESETIETLERENEVLKAKLAALEQEMHTRSPTKKTKTTAKTPAKPKVLQENSNTNIATNPFLASLRGRECELTPGLNQIYDSAELHESSPRKLSLRNSTTNKTSLADGVDGLETPGTTKKKVRKLTTRKWDLGDPDEI